MTTCWGSLFVRIQRGYARAAIEPFGLRREGMLNSELITLPLPQNPDWVEKEERAISNEVRLLAHSVLASGEDALAGPWIELWFRPGGEHQ
jgi:hypothetical protein